MKKLQCITLLLAACLILLSACGGTVSSVSSAESTQSFSTEAGGDTNTVSPETSGNPDAVSSETGGDTGDDADAAAASDTDASEGTAEEVPPADTASDDSSPASVPDITGTWMGESDSGDGASVSVILTVMPDGSGICFFSRGDITENYDVGAIDSNNHITLSIPSGNELKLESWEADFTVDGDTLSLHITAVYTDDGTQEYDLVCDKT